MIKERPGEPRFGLDIGGQPCEKHLERPRLGRRPAGWWPGAVLSDHWSTPTNVTATQPLEADDPEKTEQKNEDSNITWSKDMSSAELAYVLYQVPVLVAVHASEMLPKPEMAGG